MITRTWQRIVYGFCFVFFNTTFGTAQETKSFPDADCSYTLPGKEWRWTSLDFLPQQPEVKNIIFTQNSVDKLRFFVRYHELQKDPSDVVVASESFEAGMLESTRNKKLNSKHGTFNNVPFYQIEFALPGGQGTSMRLIYAHKRLYELHLINVAGPFEEKQNHDAAFEGFAFTKPPDVSASKTAKAPQESSTGESRRSGQQSAFFLTCCGAVVFIVVIFAVGVYLIVRNQRQDHSDRDD